MCKASFWKFALIASILSSHMDMCELYSWEISRHIANSAAAAATSDLIDRNIRATYTTQWEWVQLLFLGAQVTCVTTKSTQLNIIQCVNACGMI